MADPTTSNIVLAVPTRGSDVGAWDVPLNGDMTILDACFGSVTTVATTGAAPTVLTATQAQANLIRVTGTLAGNASVTLPAIVKSWYVENLCVMGNLYVTLGNASGGQIVGLPPGEVVQVVSDGTNVKFVNLGRIGSYIDYSSATVPSWVTACTVPPFLNCDGTTYSSVTYPSLFAILGTTTLPDLRGRSRAYLNGGTGRLTTAIGGVDGNTIFAAGGNQGITLDATQIPSITPAFVGSAMTAGLNTLANVLTSSGFAGQTGQGPLTGNLLSTGARTDSFTPAGNITPFGGGLSHPNVQPIQISGITLIRSA